MSNDLIAMSYAERVAQPCIGQERADLVLAGCAILEALLRIWPCQRLRVADRGLREGILATLMAEDGQYRRGGNRHRGDAPVVRGPAVILRCERSEPRRTAGHLTMTGAF